MISPTGENNPRGMEGLHSAVPADLSAHGQIPAGFKPILRMRAHEVFQSLKPGNEFEKRHEQTLEFYQDRAIGCIYGGAGTGKGTVSSNLARTLGVGYIDSGAIFRALTLVAGRAGYKATPEREILSPKGTLVDEDSRELVKLIRLVANLPIKFQEVKNSAAPAILLSSRDSSGVEDVTSTIRTGIDTGLLSSLAANPNVQRTLFNFIREITPDRSVVEGRENIPFIVFAENAFKTVVELRAEPRVVAARRLAQERGGDANWREILQDPREVEALSEISLLIQRRNLLDGVAQGPVPKYVHSLDTTRKSVIDSVAELGPIMNQMFAEWEKSTSRFGGASGEAS